MINTSLLRSIIKEGGYNSNTLAEEILVSPDTISNLLTGKHTPSYYVQTSLFCCLNLTGDEFINIFFSHNPFK